MFIEKLKNHLTILNKNQYMKDEKTFNLCLNDKKQIFFLLKDFMKNYETKNKVATKIKEVFVFNSKNFDNKNELSKDKLENLFILFDNNVICEFNLKNNLANRWNIKTVEDFIKNNEILIEDEFDIKLKNFKINKDNLRNLKNILTKVSDLSFYNI